MIDLPSPASWWLPFPDSWIESLFSGPHVFIRAITSHFASVLRKGKFLKLLKFYPHIWLKVCVDVVFEVRKQYLLVSSVAFVCDIFILDPLCVNLPPLLLLFIFVSLRKLVGSFFNLQCSEISQIRALVCVYFYPFCWAFNSESPFHWKIVSFTSEIHIYV